MGMDKLSEPMFSGARRNLIRGAVLAIFIAVSGCSLVPDSANPVKWYHNTVDYFTGNNTEGQEAHRIDKKLGTLQSDRGMAPPGEGLPEPNLGNFPKGLRGDDRGPKYASAPIARQGRVVSKPADKPAMPLVNKMLSGSSPPPPRAVPNVPVQKAQINNENPPSLASVAPRLTPPKPEIRMKLSNEFSGSSSEPLQTVIISTAGVSLGGWPVVSAVNGQAGSFSGQLATRLSPTSSTTKDVALVGRIKVATIVFNNGSARLTGKDVDILQDVLKLKRERNGKKIVVVGHASSRTKNMDPVHRKMVNFNISLSRADTVAKELRRLGLKFYELSINAVSDAEPVFFEFMPSGEAGNRRAEVFIEFPT